MAGGRITAIEPRSGAPGAPRDRRARTGGGPRLHRHPHALRLHLAPQSARREQDPPGRHHRGGRQLRLLGGAGAARHGPMLLGDYLAASAPWLPFRETTFAQYLDTFPATVGERCHAGRPQHAAADDGGHGQPRRTPRGSWPPWSASWRRRSRPARSGSRPASSPRPGEFAAPEEIHGPRARAAAPRRPVLHAHPRRGQPRLRGRARGHRRRARPPASTSRSRT